MKVKYKGKVYPSKKALADAVGINYDVLNMRMYRGLTLKQAVEFKSKYTIKYNKVEYETQQQLIDSLGLDITVNQLRHRVRLCDGSLAKAIKYQPRNLEVTYKGKTYNSVKHLCEKLGLK